MAGCSRTQGRIGVRTDSLCPYSILWLPLELDVVPEFNKNVPNRFYLPLNITLVPNPREAHGWGHAHNLEV